MKTAIASKLGQINDILPAFKRAYECPNCGHLLVTRSGLGTPTEDVIVFGQCVWCGEKYDL